MKNLTPKEIEILEDVSNKINEYCSSIKFDFNKNSEQEISIPCEKCNRCDSIYITINTR